MLRTLWTKGRSKDTGWHGEAKDKGHGPEIKASPLVSTAPPTGGD
jgi:hypothetical protein